MPMRVRGYQGRNNNTPAPTAVQGVLIDALKLISSGLNTSQTGDDAYRQFFSTTATGTNLLGVIPGTDLADEYVMVGAHTGHFPPLGSDIFNGATDNAAGAAVVLAIGAAIQSLPTAPRRSVILALWDAEEDGLVGSLAYANSPLMPLASTIAYINFDVLGAKIAQQSLDTRVLSRADGQDRGRAGSGISCSSSSTFRLAG